MLEGDVVEFPAGFGHALDTTPSLQFELYVEYSLSFRFARSLCKQTCPPVPGYFRLG